MQPTTPISRVDACKAPVELIPNRLEQLRLAMMERFAALGEGQCRTRAFAQYITSMVNDVHDDVVGEILQAMQNPDDRQTVNEYLQQVLQHLDVLERGIGLLANERTRQWSKNSALVGEAMRYFNQTAEELASTIISKDLLERQGRVLESIILSHERISQWKEFVQEILSDFHGIFPFDFFFIAFAEENGLSLYLYYMGEYTELERRLARGSLSEQMLDKLSLPREAVINVEEFQVLQGRHNHSPADIEMISVAVPERSLNLAGMLGVACASSQQRSSQEISVIRSILSVMVMVVGSSRALSRTLSELEYYAVHDPLTGLHNRRHFGDMLEYEINRAERYRYGYEFSILFCDLDDFKDINDSYGHLVGDQALRTIAQALRNELRKGDVVARVGGDEFAIMLAETGPENALAAGEKLRAAIRDLRFQAGDGRSFRTTASIGLVAYPRDARTVADLMACVDVAMYQAKHQGKDSVCDFVGLGETVRTARNTRTYAETVREALNEQRIVPYFQPILETASGRLHGFETLARMVNEDGNTIAAAAFIDVINKYGLSRDLDRCIIQQAFEEVRRQAEAMDGLRLFVNLSPQEIQSRNILSFAERLCGEIGLAPKQIVFEITEHDAISDMTHMGRFLANLRASGFAFALDDFGSGYNSFHYLRELHFEYVKIDGAFVRNITHSKVDYALVDNLTRLCHDLGMLTIGEFVETPEILEAMRAIGIDYAQGYQLGMPQPSIAIP
jgi:diguanylate cyclase (GGDEF)-like protein